MGISRTISRRTAVKVMGGSLAASVMALAGCGASTSSDGAVTTDAAPAPSSKTLTIGETSMIDSVSPMESGNPWSLTSDGISESVYMQDAEGKLYSNYIEELRQDDDLTWTATVKQGMKFSDETDVDAKALADCLNLIQESNPLSNSTAGKCTFTANEDGSLKIQTGIKCAAMDSFLCEWSNIVFKKVDDTTFVFSGPYKIDDLNPGVELTLSPNPGYPDADRRPKITIKAFGDTTAMQQAYESGEIDMAFTVTPDVKATLEGEGHKTISFDAGYQYMGYVNTKSAALSDVKVRQAISYALNRDDMVTALKGGEVATGVFAHYYSFAGDNKPEFDTAKAESLLDEAGWAKGADGTRAKDGQKLSVRLVTYASRPDLPVVMQLAASQLKQVGIDATTEIVDAIDDAGKSGSFDIMFYAQHTAPTGNPVSFLAMTFKTGGAKDFTGYSSPDFDALVTEMSGLPNGEQLDELAKQAQNLLYQDLPVLYLVDPTWYAAVSDDLADYKPYCGDYYVVNAELGLD